MDKKAYKKAKRKAIRPWKGLSIFCGILSAILVIALVFVNTFDNTVAAFLGGTFWQLEKEDPNAKYFESGFSDVEELNLYGIEICKQVEAEGAALLLNNNNALPLKTSEKISCLSNSSVNLVYGGTGSGNIDASKADNLKTALTKEGFAINESLWNFYLGEEMQKYARAVGGTVSLDAAKVSEVPWSEYSQDVLASISEYSDVALMVISRVGGEGADLDYKTVNYLSLNEDEKELFSQIAKRKAEGTIKKIVVLINSANPVQVDFLKNNEYQVDACLWIGDVGISGINAVAEILSGKVNPSGSLVDTYCYDNYSAPAMKNFTPITYLGYEKNVIPEKAKTYMIYQEGIYVGYKYYETRYEDFCMEKGNAGNYNYQSEVAFPFGYGLSYTDFSYSDLEVRYDKATDRFEVRIYVTNEGDTYSGKETVQVYVQTPYTEYDIENHVEKPSVALCGFGKTKILAPGESQDLLIYVDQRDIASYDAYGAKTYIMDAGNYFMTVATDAHNAANNILSAKGYTVENTNGRMDADGNPELVCTWNQETIDTVSYSTSKNGTTITNQLEGADLNLYAGSDMHVTYLSRNDWVGTYPKEPLEITLTEQLISDLQDVQYKKENYPSMNMPTLGAKNGIKLYDMIGLDYDDEKWEKLLDQLTFEEMVSLIGDAFHWTMPIESVQAPGTRDENGPQGLTASLLASGATTLEATAFTSEDVMAATFNIDLMSEIGKVIGGDCVEANIACLYGPGNNIHRTPYGGRNFEYYSEDGFLSGKMSSYEVKEIQNKGVHVVMKHFALNDSEQDRIGLGVWLPEQAAREVYLKAFEAPIVEGNGNGVMIAYTRWGCIWSGGNKGLVTGILRNEWGCDGMIITDNVLTSYVNGVDGIMAGVSIYDAMMPFVVQQLPKYKKDPVIVSAMKEACHHNLYAIANSVGMNGVGADTVVKPHELLVVRILKVAAVVTLCLFIFSLVMFIIKKRKFKQSDVYIRYRKRKEHA